MFDEIDQRLLRAAREGDGPALEQLLTRHQPRIYGFGLRLCRDPEDAADVLQETLLAMARSVHDFRGASSLSTWLFTIARSFCIKKRRRSKFAPRTVVSLEALPDAERERLVAAVASPEETAANRELGAALERAIASLGPAHRDVLVLRDVEGLSAPEVGEVLGLSPEAVKSRLHRARLSVRDRLSPLLGPTGSRAAACPDVLTLFSKHLEGDVDRELCARMEQHLASCRGCTSTCDSLRRTLALCRAAPEPEIPPEIREKVRRALRRLLAS
jgi:RNA polymerase sigma-70 factor (ECF subfamily)